VDLRLCHDAAYSVPARATNDKYAHVIKSGPYEDDDDAFPLGEMMSYSGRWWTIAISFLSSYYGTNQVLGNERRPSHSCRRGGRNLVVRPQ
jgi:hypothetical protein